ncbi:terminase large subunit [Lactobacillus selangorensis]|nr:terminase TerL endonuclease subunit [Lactobacillus selangorensis]
MDKIDLLKTKDVLGAYRSQDYTKIKAKYTDPGTQYAFSVLDGKQLSGYMMKLACFRHLQDLKRAETDSPDFPYHYDLKKVRAILNFAKLCPDVETGKPSELMPWQKLILCELIGWRDVNGNKRFAQAIVSVARAQGKTYFASIIACYSLLLETIGKENQDLLVASNVTSQSQKLFGYVTTMVNKLIDTVPAFGQLAKQWDLQPQHDQIIAKKPYNRLVRLSNESGKFDSYHFLTAVYDEIGELKDDKNISKITSGQVHVDDKQFIQISTAYPDPSVTFHSDEDMLQEAMEQDYKREADTYLCLVWAQDSLDETFKPDTWIKSNPLLGLPSMHDKLFKGLMDERDTKLLQGKIADFQNKNMNVWLQEDVDSYLKLDEIEKATISHFDIRGRDVYIGYDLSMSSDNTALGFVFPYFEGNEKKFHVRQFSFIPWHAAGSLEAKEKQDGIAYRDLPDFCKITSHEQGLISLDEVYAWLLDFVHENNLHPVGFFYDAWHMDSMVQSLDMNTNWQIVPVRQRTSELNDPTKFMQKLFIEGNITRLDDPIMAKALQNAVLVSDTIGIQVDKKRATLKIDVVDALIDGFYQGMYHFEDFADVNDKSKEFERMSETDVQKWIEENGIEF